MKSKLIVQRDGDRVKVWIAARKQGHPYQVWRPDQVFINDLAGGRLSPIRGECEPMGEPSLILDELCDVWGSDTRFNQEVNLDDAGFVYSLSRAMYVNKATRKALTEQFVRHMPADEIHRCLTEDHGPGWKFYSLEPMSEGVRRELERLLS